MPARSPALTVLAAVALLGPPVAAALAPATPSPAAAAPAPGSTGSPGTGGARSATARDGCVPPGTARPPRPAGAPAPYRCPLPGPLASAFAAPQTRYSAGHRGVDLLADAGQPVAAPAAGRVTFAGMVAGRPVLTLDHGGGWRTSVEPVRAVVPVGAAVAAGAVVGVVGPEPGHCAPRTCLHLGVRRGEDYVDPLSLLGRRRVVLLPLGG